MDKEGPKQNKVQMEDFIMITNFFPNIQDQVNVEKNWFHIKL
jgi:hypothetical protein